MPKVRRWRAWGCGAAVCFASWGRGPFGWCSHAQRVVCCTQTIVIDARAHMLGRLASVVAKQLLNGYQIVSGLPGARGGCVRAWVITSGRTDGASSSTGMQQATAGRATHAAAAAAVAR
jgi:hypothetical protein